SRKLGKRNVSLQKWRRTVRVRVDSEDGKAIKPGADPAGAPFPPRLAAAADAPQGLLAAGPPLAGPTDESHPIVGGAAAARRGRPCLSSALRLPRTLSVGWNAPSAGLLRGRFLGKPHVAAAIRRS